MRPSIVAVLIVLASASGALGAKVKFLWTWKAPDANDLAWFERSGVAGVVVLRLTDIARETTPPSVMWASPTYGSLWSSYPYKSQA